MTVRDGGGGGRVRTIAAATGRLPRKRRIPVDKEKDADKAGSPLVLLPIAAVARQPARGEVTNGASWLPASSLP